MGLKKYILTRLSNSLHKNGDIRIIRKFLFLPKRMEDSKEYRWLEWVNIEQKFWSGYGDGFLKDIKFIT